MQNKVGLHGVRDIAPWILNILNTSQLGASTFPQRIATCLAVLQERQEHLMALESSGAVLSDPFQNR